MLFRSKTVMAEATVLCENEAWTVLVGGATLVIADDLFKYLFEPVGLEAEQGGEIVDIAGFDLSWCKDASARNLINELIGLEAVSTDNTIDGPSWMFKPYPISTLGKLLQAVVEDMHWTWGSVAAPTVDAPKFLEVGCGVGTKLLMVEKVFGLDVSGFDYNRDYVRDANALLESRDCRGTAFKADARTITTPYEAADVIWLNRPFVHMEPQRELERMVFRRMHAGAYVILGNYASDLGDDLIRGWYRIAEDKVAVVLRKPVL